MVQVRSKLLLVSLVLLTLSIAYAADSDPIADQVLRARQAYQMELDALREEAAKELEAKEAAERKRDNPDQERIDAIAKEREALESDGKFPDSISSKLKSKLNKNLGKFTTALTAAKNQYTLAKKDKEAESLLVEMEHLKFQLIQPKASSDGPGSKKPSTASSTKSSRFVPRVPSTVKNLDDVANLNIWPKAAPPFAVAPFDLVKAKKLQLAWAKYLKIPPERTNSIGMKLVLIPPGEFLMGSSPQDMKYLQKAESPEPQAQKPLESETPQHKVILTHPIYMGAYEVTSREYAIVMGVDPGPGGTNPVEKVSWIDAAVFCSKLSEKEELKPCYSIEGPQVTRVEGTGYRMATEAEWEYACRAGTTTLYSSGNDLKTLLDFAWFEENTHHYHQVGQRKPNAFGLYDMHGNNLEWVDDTYDATFYAQFEKAVAINPHNQSTSSVARGNRGGEWARLALRGRSASRAANALDARYERIGFRVVLIAGVSPDEMP